MKRPAQLPQSPPIANKWVVYIAPRVGVRMIERPSARARFFCWLLLGWRWRRL